MARTSTSILLARHGETDANGRGTFIGRRDVPLNAAGRAQARALAARVRRLGVARLYASPLVRARETAEIVADAVGIPPTVDARLAETDHGRWQGRPKAEAKAAEPDLYRSLRTDPETFRYPDGESLAEHQRRVRTMLREIAGHASRALVICHHGTVRCALTLGHPRGLAAWREFEVRKATVVELPAAALAALTRR